MTEELSNAEKKIQEHKQEIIKLYTEIGFLQVNSWKIEADTKEKVHEALALNKKVDQLLHHLPKKKEEPATVIEEVVEPTKESA